VTFTLVQGSTAAKRLENTALTKLVAGLSPNSIMPTFTEISPQGKVMDTNHESCRQKLSRHVEMFATKIHDKSATNSFVLL